MENLFFLDLPLNNIKLRAGASLRTLSLSMNWVVQIMNSKASLILLAPTYPPPIAILGEFTTMNSISVYLYSECSQKDFHILSSL